MRIALALAVTLASAFALNLGYLVEHDAAQKLPPLSLRAPLRSVRQLVGNRRWLLGFASEATGWVLFVLALSLAPLSLVQATAAGGIAILALMVAHVTHVPLTTTERFGVGIAVAGLVLLGLSLAGAHGEGKGAGYVSVAVWIGASFAGAFVAIMLLARRIGDGPAYGLATGLLFASGDVATKGAVEAGGHLGFVAALILGLLFGQSRAAGGIPAQQRAHDRRHRHALHERAADRRRDDDLRRAAAERLARRRPGRRLRGGYRRRRPPGRAKARAQARQSPDPRPPAGSVHRAQPVHRRRSEMNCPIDGIQPVMSERSGVEIDCCPECRGVWVDRGELDKIIDRATSGQPRADPGGDDAVGDGEVQPGKRRRRGFLVDLLELGE